MNNKEEVEERVMREFNTCKQLCLQLPTGIGKSLLAIKMLEKTNLDITNKDSGKQILLLVSERAHMENWKEEFHKWGYDELYKKCLIVTYASLHKLSGSFSAVIADEVHHLCTENRLSLIVNISFPVFIGVSATVGRDRFRMLQSLYPKMKMLSMSLQKAIDENILPDPQICYSNEAGQPDSQSGNSKSTGKKG